MLVSLFPCLLCALPLEYLPRVHAARPIVCAPVAVQVNMRAYVAAFNLRGTTQEKVGRKARRSNLFEQRKAEHALLLSELLAIHPSARAQIYGGLLPLAYAHTRC
eukprot:5361802-Pleurochrysis_carterae.AAC.1